METAAAQPEATAKPEEKAQVAAQQAPEQKAPESKTPENDPNWLKSRLESAEKSAAKKLLESLGVQSLEDAKAAIERAKQAELEKLSEQERTQKLIQELAPKAQKAEQLLGTVRSYAERELSTLTEVQQGVVKSLAGDDPDAILRTIGVLRPTWATAAEKPAQPASTSNASPAPPAVTTNSPEDAKAVYGRLQKTDPFAAAEYLLTHRREIYGAQ